MDENLLATKARKEKEKLEKEEQIQSEVEEEMKKEAKQHEKLMEEAKKMIDGMEGNNPKVEL